MYSEKYKESLAVLAAARANNISAQPRRLSAKEKEVLLQKYHPDHQKSGFSTLSVGANKGEALPTELCTLLSSGSRIDGSAIDLSAPRYDTDVLIIGGGGAGLAAAIEAAAMGAKVMIATKLRVGDSNTVMAEGGIQAADKQGDSPALHFLDSYGGGHFLADRELLAKLVREGPEAIRWLTKLGVDFDKTDDGALITTHGGGTSRRRMHACKDMTGAHIMNTLRDEVYKLGIPTLEYSAAIELVLDTNGRAAGAILMDTQTGEYSFVRAKAVIIATGGAGRLHIGGFPTSNHYGATADGLVLAYRAGAGLVLADSMQYHPTGAAYPTQIVGALVTEKARSLGARLVNARGEVFIHPLETRDTVTAAIIAQCQSPHTGIDTPNGRAVWLDTPMIDMIGGEGTTERRLPAMVRMFANFGIDIRREPILVYPTLHYQNGGIKINTDAEAVGVPDLFVAGEAAGGIHGRNRLMGNSLLDIIVFGRTAGKCAAARARLTNHITPTLSFLDRFEAERRAAGIDTNLQSPILLADCK